MTASQWLVLDNLSNSWSYDTNLTADQAELAYLTCVENQWVRDGKLTESGKAALLSKRIYETIP